MWHLSLTPWIAGHKIMLVISLKLSLVYQMASPWASKRVEGVAVIRTGSPDDSLDDWKNWWTIQRVTMAHEYRLSLYFNALYLQFCHNAKQSHSLLNHEVIQKEKCAATPQARSQNSLNNNKILEIWIFIHLHMIIKSIVRLFSPSISI